MHDTNVVLIPIKKANSTRIIHHYEVIQKLGFPPGVKCWCGNTLEFAVKEPWAKRSTKRKEFFDLHDECQP